MHVLPILLPALPIESSAILHETIRDRSTFSFLYDAQRYDYSMIPSFMNHSYQPALIYHLIAYISKMGYFDRHRHYWA